MDSIPGELTGSDFVAILEALASGVSVANADGRIIYSNRAADRILGIMRTDAPPSEWAGHYGVLDPANEEPFPEDRYPLVRALAGEHVDDVELLIRNPKLNGDVTIQCSARPLRNGGDSIAGAVVIFRDVTALKKAQADREELTAFIMHDLKSPLSTVMALAELTETAEEIDPDQVREDAVETRAAAERMHRMVMDLLDIQLAGEGRLEAERELVDGRDLLEDVRRATHVRAPGLIIGRVHNGLQVLVDRSLMFRLLVNLVDNCVKYGPKDGKIILEAMSESDGSVRISVQDEGPGVPVELREQIFDRYAQLERGTVRRVADSRGLGLRFCRVVAEAHGGRIWVEDAQPNGARFCLSLPAPAA